MLKSRRCSPYLLLAMVFMMIATPLQGTSTSPVDVEVLEHHWRPDVVWEKIGKTKFFWSATVRNHSNVRRRVFVYYDLLSADDIPLASNVANKTIEPLQTVEITSDSYINNTFLPQVKSSRVTIKLGFPN